MTTSTKWKAVVVGGCGFLGHRIIKGLVESKQYTDVTGIDLRTDNNLIDSVVYHRIDLTSSEQVSKIFAKVEPDVLFHTASPPAATSNLSLYMKVNVEGTRTLIKCASEAGVRAFVFTSSASVIHDSVSDLLDADESAPILHMPVQREAYSHSKALSEELVTAANDPANGFLTTSLRPSSIFGEGDLQTIARLVELGREGKNRIQIGDGKNLFDHTYVGNLVQAHLLAAGKLLTRDFSAGRVDGEAFLITNDEPVPFWDFIRRVGAEAGYPVKSGEVKVINRTLGLIMAFVAEWWVWVFTFGKERSTFNRTGVRYSTLARTYNISKAKSRLGYRADTNMHDAIKNSVTWYQNYQAKQSLEKRKD